MDENKIIYPELSFKIIGCLFEVFKKFGYGHREKHYQKAIARELTEQNIVFQEQFPIKLIYKDSKIGQKILIF